MRMNAALNNRLYYGTHVIIPNSPPHANPQTKTVPGVVSFKAQ